MAELRTLKADALMTINDSLQRLRDSVPIKAHPAIESTSLVDVRLTAQNIEHNQKPGENCNLTRLNHLIDRLEGFSRVTSNFLEVKILSWAWGMAKWLLETTVDDLPTMNQLLAAYKRVGQAFPRFDGLNIVEPIDDRLQLVSAVCLADIFYFHESCCELISNYGSKNPFPSSWTRLQRRHKVIIDDLLAWERLLKGALTVENTLTGKERREECMRRAQEENQSQSKADLINAQSWLKANEFGQEDDLDELLNLCHESSADWIFDHPKVKAWIRGGRDHTVFWLKGMPGAGKSVLCSKLIERLQSSETAVVLYFLCISTRPESLHCKTLLHSLVWQLVLKRPCLAAMIQDECISQGCQSTALNLRKLLHLMIRAFSSVRIIIDGVDECDEVQQKAILEEVRKLADLYQDSAVCKVLVSSQDTMSISRKLRARSILDLNAERHSVQNAITSFVHTQVVGSRLFADAESFGAVDIAMVEQTLVNKAGGMFLWVRLVMYVLEDAFSAHDIQQALADLPEGLDKVYDRIFSRLRTTMTTLNYDRVSRIFQWLTFSQRPLQNFELQHAVDLRFDNPQIRTDTRVFESVFELCKPLVESGSGNTIRFVHASVKEYIVKHQPYFSKELAHGNIAFACVTYLLYHGMSLLDEDCDQDSARVEVARGVHGLCRYAIEHWLEHLLAYMSNPDVSPSEHQNIFLALDNLAVKLSRHSPSSLENLQANVDSRLDKLCGREPAHTVITQALAAQSARRTSPMKASEPALDKDDDPLSRIRQTFQTMAKEILQADSVAGIDEKTLQNFKRTYGMSILVCRHSDCLRAAHGFDSVQDRDTHEATHQLRCPHTTCFYYRVGISTAKKLKEHLANSHREDYRQNVSKSVPKFRRVRSVSPASKDLKRNRSVTPTSLDGFPYQAQPQASSENVSMLSTEDNKAINLRAAEMASQTPKETMKDIVQKMSPQFCDNLRAKGVEPIIYYFRMLATKEFRTVKNSTSGQQQLHMDNNSLTVHQQLDSQHPHPRPASPQPSSFTLPDALLAQYPALRNIDWAQARSDWDARSKEAGSMGRASFNGTSSGTRHDQHLDDLDSGQSLQQYSLRGPENDKTAVDARSDQSYRSPRLMPTFDALVEPQSPLEPHQEQLLLLEKQNKARLARARRDSDIDPLATAQILIEPHTTLDLTPEQATWRHLLNEAEKANITMSRSNSPPTPQFNYETQFEDHKAYATYPTASYQQELRDAFPNPQFGFQYSPIQGRTSDSVARPGTDKPVPGPSIMGPQSKSASEANPMQGANLPDFEASRSENPDVSQATLSKRDEYKLQNFLNFSQFSQGAVSAPREEGSRDQEQQPFGPREIQSLYHTNFTTPHTGSADRKPAQSALNQPISDFTRGLFEDQNKISDYNGYQPPPPLDYWTPLPPQPPYLDYRLPSQIPQFNDLDDWLVTYETAYLSPPAQGSTLPTEPNLPDTTPPLDTSNSKINLFH